MVTLLGALVVWSWMMTWVWLWFVVPIFAVRPITTAEAFGLKTLAELLRPIGLPRDKQGTTFAEDVFTAYVTPLFLLLLAYLAHLVA
jgi:hypothetical protein